MSPKKHTTDNNYMKNISIPNYKGNANKNHNEISPYTVGMAITEQMKCKKC